MRSGLFLTIVVYGLVFMFVGRAKMRRSGDYSQQNREVGSPGQSYHRARTTINTTQRTSVPMRPKSQQTAATRLPKPIHLNNSFGMGKEHDDFISSEKRKNGGGIGKNKEVDCDLDERIFGSRHQHKDIF